MKMFQTLTGASSTSSAIQWRRSVLIPGTRCGNAPCTASASKPGCRITGSRSHHSLCETCSKAASHQPTIGG